MKKIKKTLLYLLGFAALLLVITVIINLPAFDEELLPEVVAIKNIQAEPFSEDNAYPALLAINGASGKTLHQAAEEVRRFLNQKIEATGVDYLDSQEYNTLIGRGHDKSWQNLYINCNSRSDKNCMAKLHLELKQNPISDERLIEQISRYADFIQHPKYQEMTQLKFDSPLPPYGALVKLKRLFLADAYANDNIEKYMFNMDEDFEFWRMVLSNSNQMITKMIAVATISDSINSLSAALKKDQFNAKELLVLQKKTNVLNDAEIDLSRVFDFELKHAIKTLDVIEIDKSLIGTFDHLFYQSQATHNFNYLHTTVPLNKLTALSSLELNQYMKSDQKTEDFASPVKWSISMLYNPIGKTLVGHAMPAYTDYIGRMHDLNGLFYLLKLQIEIALNTDRAVEQVISQSKYTNPYTLEPMNYNSERHSIYFQCMDKTSVCELVL